MALVVALLALAAAALNAAGAGLGAYRWSRAETSTWFWRLVRAGQAAAALVAVAAGVGALAGGEPDDALFWLYALLPLAVSLIGEQLRLVSAQTVLDARGLESADAIRALPEREQRGIVLDIVRREMGVMAIAAGVVAFLLLRAAALTTGL